MFTDMVGYTDLGQRNEPLSLALVEEQRKLVRPVLDRHGGREVKTMGDAFLIEFPNTLDAVKCAYEIQRAAREFNMSRPPERTVHLRIGIHVGDVVESQGDILGDAVNVASRIESLAEDGGVRLTRQVYDQVQSKFELPLKSLGVTSLKKLSTPLEVYKMVMPWEERVVSLTEVDRKRIAVLPLTNISPDPRDEYFADGMTEELISTMSRISGLKVIARTSVAGYKGSSKKISEIGKELEVGTVLEGSVRKVGDRLRISVQLIDSQTSEHLWADNYDRELKDVFAIQSEISKTVAEALTVQLLSREKALIEKKQTVNPEAYALYLKGRVYWNERTKEDVSKALKFFEQAVRIDSEFALAYSGLADCYNVLEGYSWMAPHITRPLARDFATKALRLDESLAEAHASLGLTLMQTWDFRGAERELKRAIELRPNYAPAYYWYAQLLLFQRKYGESFLQDRRGFDIDPFSAWANLRMANRLADTDRIDEAMERFQRATELDPNSASIHLSKSNVLARLGQSDAAIEEARKAVELDKSPDMEVNLAWVYAVAGKKNEAKAILNKIENKGGDESFSPAFIGAVKLELGDSEEGFRLIERGFEEREDGVLYFGSLPEFKKYWSDPRWVQIEKKIAALQGSENIEPVTPSSVKLDGAKSPEHLAVE
jgi:TolB-like protein/tetratricopeptide (TPR) repeat protein